jgi:pimeloyl-ACP methyl ester carboxylesterase
MSLIAFSSCNEPLKTIFLVSQHIFKWCVCRRNSQKVLYLQHGLLDSSLGWVSSGVVGSQAFAAYDQGYDVFLGNFRGLASREHVDKHISAQRCAVQLIC